MSSPRISFTSCFKDRKVELELITDIAYFSDNNNKSTSFNFSLKKTGQTGNDGIKDVEIMVPLKYLSKFWRTRKNA